VAALQIASPGVTGTLGPGPKRLCYIELLISPDPHRPVNPLRGKELLRGIESQGRSARRTDAHASHGFSPY
jgi:hypothetical protein